jgi:hypothetical protein
LHQIPHSNDEKVKIFPERQHRNLFPGFWLWVGTSWLQQFNSSNLLKINTGRPSANGCISFDSLVGPHVFCFLSETKLHTVEVKTQKQASIYRTRADCRYKFYQQRYLHFPFHFSLRSIIQQNMETKQNIINISGDCQTAASSSSSFPHPD